VKVVDEGCLLQPARQLFGRDVAAAQGLAGLHDEPPARKRVAAGPGNLVDDDVAARRLGVAPIHLVHELVDRAGVVEKIDDGVRAHAVDAESVHHD